MMATFTFKWPHASDEGEVYVTGTFDNWSKSVQLDKQGDVFQKTVILPDSSEKFYYKFVVDGKWTTDHEAPHENDLDGNFNNVLRPENYLKANGFTMQSSGPGTTMGKLAEAVSLKNSEPFLPGGYPETPSVELDKEVKVDPLPYADGSVNPIKLAPGQPVPKEFTSADINSHVTLDKESYEKGANAAELDKQVKVDPLPYADGAVNPIKLVPGQPVPKEFTSADINSHVTLDKESYEKGADTGILGVESLPPLSKNMIPESSLPIASPNDPFIQSIGPSSTTVELANQVPVKAKEPDDNAKLDTETSEISSQMERKAKNEQKLQNTVPGVLSTSEGTAGNVKGTENPEKIESLTEAAGLSAVAAGAAAVETTVFTKDKTVAAASDATKLPGHLKTRLPLPGQLKENGDAVDKEAMFETGLPESLAAVKNSIKKVEDGPEAAANKSASEAKKAVEGELRDGTKLVGTTGEAASETNQATVATNEAGSGSTAANDSKLLMSPTTPDKKKKKRISALFNKLIGKNKVKQ